MSDRADMRTAVQILAIIVGTHAAAHGQLIRLDNNAELKLERDVEIIPGAVELHNGLILRGECSTGSALPGSSLRNSRLVLRKIDQGFRAYYASTRTSDRIVPDNLAVPDRHYDLRQRSISRKPLNYEIGLHTTTPFSADGKATVSLLFAGGESVDVQVGITNIDYRFAKVRGLTHRWTYGVSLNAIPEATLYAGEGLPALLPNVAGFDRGETRLNLVQMLMEAEKYQAAQLLLADTQREFPALEDRCLRLVAAWNDQVGDRLLVELDRMRSTGKHRLARRYARNWPDANLGTVIRIRARSLVEELDEEQRAVNTILSSLDTVMADIADATIRQQAMQVCSALKKNISVNTLERLSAYELLWQDPDTPPESRIALAATGWMLGADHAVDEFPEAFGLFQIRFRLIDYLLTGETETRQREQLIEQIRSTEGFSVERVAQLLQQLDPVQPLNVRRDDPLLPGRFILDNDDAGMSCTGSVPAEYDEARRYPLLLAFAPGGGAPQATLNLWGKLADRYGYILVVPEIFDPQDGVYHASARQHQRMLNLIRRLKSGLSIDDDRIFIAGHGVGSQVAIDLATAHPNLFAGVMPIAPAPRKHFLWTVGNSPELPWYVVAGTRQPGYAPDLLPLLSRLFTRIPDAGRLSYCNAMAAVYPERGFESYAEELPQVFDWMQLQRRPTKAPDRINASILRHTDRDWGWLTLSNINERFTELDDPTTPDYRPKRTGQLDATIRENTNSIRLKTLPGSCSICLGPSTPHLDLQKTIRVTRAGRTHSIEFKPSIRDLLEEFRLHRDRDRLCYMKVAIP